MELYAKYEYETDNVDFVINALKARYSKIEGYDLEFEINNIDTKKKLVIVKVYRKRKNKTL